MYVCLSGWTPLPSTLAISWQRLSPVSLPRSSSLPAADSWVWGQISGSICLSSPWMSRSSLSADSARANYFPFSPPSAPEFVPLSFKSSSRLVFLVLFTSSRCYFGSLGAALLPIGDDFIFILDSPAMVVIIFIHIQLKPPL